MDSPTLASPHSSSERKVDDAAPTAQRSNSVFLDKRPYRTGCNYTSTLRSGRWMRPGDFVRWPRGQRFPGSQETEARSPPSLCLLCYRRDKVQSRGVLVLGLLCILLFIALVTISDSSFLFPKNFHAYGKPMD